MIDIPTVNTAHVFYRSQPVGRLAVRPDNRCIFEYDREWLAKGFSISLFQLPMNYLGAEPTRYLSDFNQLLFPTQRVGEIYCLTDGSKSME
jgi:hypothetical protein